MRTQRRLLILLFVLLALLLPAACVETRLDHPLYQYLSLQFEHLMLPKFPARLDQDPWITGARWLDPRNNYISPSGRFHLTLINDNDAVQIENRNESSTPDKVIHVSWLWTPKAYFSPDESEIALSAVRETSIWTTDGVLRLTLDGWEAFGYSPDGRYLLAAGKDGLALFDRQQEWRPKLLAHYAQLRGFFYSPDQQYLLTFGCTDGRDWESGFFCFHGGAALWDATGQNLADFTGQDEVIFAGFTKDMQHVVTQGCDRLWTLSRDFPLQKCLGVSTRYYDLQGNLEGIYLDPDLKNSYTTLWSW